jgi:hypothetical protein
MPTIPTNIEIVGEDEAYAVAENLQRLIQIATYTDVQATALQRRIVNKLRREGLDASGRFSWIVGTDAQRVARKVVEPLRLIHSETYNSAQNAVLFQTRIKSMVFDPIREAQKAAQQGHDELKVR